MYKNLNQIKKLKKWTQKNKFRRKLYQTTIARFYKQNISKVIEDAIVDLYRKHKDEANMRLL